MEHFKVNKLFIICLLSLNIFHISTNDAHGAQRRQEFGQRIANNQLTPQIIEIFKLRMLYETLENLRYTRGSYNTLLLYLYFEKGLLAISEYFSKSFLKKDFNSTVMIDVPIKNSKTTKKIEILNCEVALAKVRVFLEYGVDINKSQSSTDDIGDMENELRKLEDKFLENIVQTQNQKQADIENLEKEITTTKKTIKDTKDKTIKKDLKKKLSELQNKLKAMQKKPSKKELEKSQAEDQRWLVEEREKIRNKYKNPPQKQNAKETCFSGALPSCNWDLEEIKKNAIASKELDILALSMPLGVKLNDDEIVKLNNIPGGKGIVELYNYLNENYCFDAELYEEFKENYDIQKDVENFSDTALDDDSDSRAADDQSDGRAQSPRRRAKSQNRVANENDEDENQKAQSPRKSRRKERADAYDEDEQRGNNQYANQKAKLPQKPKKGENATYIDDEDDDRGSNRKSNKRARNRRDRDTRDDLRGNNDSYEQKPRKERRRRSKAQNYNDNQTDGKRAKGKNKANRPNNQFQQNPFGMNGGNPYDNQNFGAMNNFNQYGNQDPFGAMNNGSPYGNQNFGAMNGGNQYGNAYNDDRNGNYNEGRKKDRNRKNRRKDNDVDSKLQQRVEGLPGVEFNASEGTITLNRSAKIILK